MRPLHNFYQIREADKVYTLKTGLKSMNKLLHQDISSPEKSASVISEIAEVSKYHLDFLESLKSKMEDKERAASALKSLVEDSQHAR